MESIGSLAKLETFAKYYCQRLDVIASNNCEITISLAVRKIRRASKGREILFLY